MPSMQPRINLSGSSGNVGIYPVFVADPTYNVASVAGGSPVENGSSTVGGFNNDGDSIRFNTTFAATGTVEYYDEAGSQVTDGDWASGLSPSEVNASATNWCGFAMVGSLIYLAARNTAGSPNYYFATINAAGVVTEIGNSTPSTDFSTAPNWVGYTTAQPCNIQVKNGSIFLRAYVGSHVEEIEFSAVDGSVVTDTAIVASGQGALYKTVDGIYVGGYQNYSTSIGIQLSLSNGKRHALAQLPVDTGIPNIATVPGGMLYTMQWERRVVFSCYGTVPNSGIPSCNQNLFDRTIRDIAISMGVF